MRDQKDLLTKGIDWRQTSVSKIDPSNNSITAGNGETYTYDYLVLSPGVELRFDKIEGAKEALNDPNSGVASIYRLDYAYKTSALRENF